MLPAHLNGLLRQTSRTFHKSLRILPRAVRSQIGLAYLLARTTDTIADTEIIPLERRLAALQKLRARILGLNGATLDFNELARHQGEPAEQALLENVEGSLGVLRNLSPEDLKLVRQVLDTITGGQELDVRRFAGASAEKIIELQTDAELDDYTYRVAGCVGEFWTKLCRAHLFPKAPLDDARLLANGVRFGKGLQLVNILRDLPVDLRKGRCYLPSDRLAAARLTPADLLQPTSEPKFRTLYHEYLARAEDHLAAGWVYTNTLPRGCVRVRLACAWPILIGVRTLARLRAGNVLDPSQRIKISRAEVKRLVLRSVLACPFPGAWRKLFPQPSTG